MGLAGHHANQPLCNDCSMHSLVMQGLYHSNSKWAPCEPDAQALDEDEHRRAVNNVAGATQEANALLLACTLCWSACKERAAIVANCFLSADLCNHNDPHLRSVIQAVLDVGALVVAYALHLRRANNAFAFCRLGAIQ